MPDLEMTIADLPPLDDDQSDDAAFRARDRAWIALVRLFDQYQATEGLSYEKLGRRIGRSRSHVQRWLGSPFNMSMKSLGLLAEGMDADLIIDVRPRSRSAHLTNYCHPSEEARSMLVSRSAGTTPLPVTTGSALNRETGASTGPSVYLVNGALQHG